MDESLHSPDSPPAKRKGLTVDTATSVSHSEKAKKSPRFVFSPRGFRMTTRSRGNHADTAVDEDEQFYLRNKDRVDALMQTRKYNDLQVEYQALGGAKGRRRKKITGYFYSSPAR